MKSKGRIKFQRTVLASIVLMCYLIAFVIPLNTLAADTSAGQIMMNLESIQDNSYITDSVDVGGWVLIPSGVKSITATLDGNDLGNVTQYVRSDIKANFPNYTANNPNAGYDLKSSLDLSKYSVGNHTLSVTAVGNDSTQKITRTVTVKKAAIGFNLESVKDGATYMGSIPVSGWAADPSGIAKINYYIDGSSTPVKSTLGSSFTSRPDVYKYVDLNGKLNYKNADNFGFSDWIDVSGYTGTHTLTAEAVGNDGQVLRTSRNITVLAKKIMMNLESIPNNSYISDSIDVRGWVLIPSGVSSIKVALDGNDLGTVSRIQRTDIMKYFPDYTATNPDSGFDLTANLDLSKYSVGSHTLSVTATGDNISQTISQTVIVTKAPIGFNLESVKDGGTYMGSIPINGWAVDPSGVSRIDYYIDGSSTPVKSTPGSSFVSRSDVYKYIDLNGKLNYKGADKFGFTDWIDVSGLTAGAHTLTAIAVGNDGQTLTTTRQVNIVGQKIMMNLESIADNSYISDSIDVNGWVLIPSGVKSITVTLDGNNLSTVATYVRSDIMKYFPDYTAKNPNAGYELKTNLDLSKYMVGNHTLTVTAVGNNQAQTIVKTITVKKAAPGLNLESVKDGGTYMGSIPVNGWATNASGVSRIDYYIDSATSPVKSTPASSFVSRPDVYKYIDLNGKLNYKGADKFGFTDWVDVSNLTGWHTLTADAVGNDGQVLTTTRRVNIVPESAMMNIESPGSDAPYLTNNMRITGWVLLPSGVKSMSYSLDGNVANATVNYSDRTDIDRTFPSYKLNNPTAGYSIQTNISLSSLSYGSHTITVTAVGNDGSTFVRSMTVYKASPKTNVESPAVGTNITYKDSSVTVSGWTVNVSGIKQVVVNLNGNQVGCINTSNSQLGVRNDVEQYVDLNGKAGYQDAVHSGFSFNVDVSSLPFDTSFSIRVIAYGYDGSEADQTISLYKSRTDYTHYNITESHLADLNGVDQSLIDPETILNGSNHGVYQFLDLGVYVNVSASSIDNILQNCGSLRGHGQDFLDACNKYNINPVYFVAHTIIESGRGSSKLANGIWIPAGTYTDSQGYSYTIKQTGTFYNIFGIHAYDKDPVRDGSIYAGYMGWTSIRDAIFGGAEWISEHYIHNSSSGGLYDQDTLYEMKWNPEGAALHNKVCDEYAIDLDWADSIAQVINEYSNLFNGQKLYFDIPKFS